MAYNRVMEIDLRRNGMPAPKETAPTAPAKPTPATAPTTAPTRLLDLLTPTTAPARLKAFEKPLPEAAWRQGPTTAPATAPATQPAAESKKAKE
jgi:hypothetical protein